MTIAFCSLNIFSVSYYFSLLARFSGFPVSGYNSDCSVVIYAFKLCKKFAKHLLAPFGSVPANESLGLLLFPGGSLSSALCQSEMTFCEFVR